MEANVDRLRWEINKQLLQKILLQFAAHPRCDFDGGDVCHWINVLHGGIVHLSVGELHSDASLVGHNMSICDDETIAANNETRAIWHWDFSSWKWVSVKQ